MIKAVNKILLVDDSMEDLERLSIVFNENGIGCRKMEYDPFYSEPLTGVRIAFFDINLSAGGGGISDGSRNATLQDAIKRYISIKNESYVLVFWTNNPSWIGDFMQYINRTSNDEIKKPFYITYIDKNDFIDPQKRYDEKIDQILNTPAIKCLMQYDDLLSNISWKVMSQMINLLSEGRAWGETNTFEEDCKRMFASIAQQTMGVPHAKENPDLAINEATMPVIEDILRKNSTGVWREFLLESLNGKSVSFPDNFRVERLNTIFHIDSVGPFYRTDRGAVCPINCTDKMPCDLFLNHFGLNYCEWFNLSTLGKQDRKEASLIGLELSAACDYSNNKKRTNRYLLGVLIPAHCRNNIKQSNFGDYSLILPYDFEFGNEKKTLYFNLNYIFTVSHGDDVSFIQEPLFRLKKETVDFIGEKFAHHSSRIGISSFK